MIHTTKVLVHCLGCKNGIVITQENGLKFSGHTAEEARGEAPDASNLLSDELGSYTDRQTYEDGKCKCDAMEGYRCSLYHLFVDLTISQ